MHHQAHFTLFVGIDMAKTSFSVSIVDEHLTYVNRGIFTVSREQFTAFENSLSPWPKESLLFCVESTGIYHKNLVSFLTQEGFTVMVVNPVLIKNFREATSLRRTKSDAIDADLIARYCLQNHRTHRLSGNAENGPLRILARQREYCACAIARCKTRYRQTLFQVFPELESAGINIYTDTIMELLERFPSPHLMTAISADQFGKNFLNVIATIKRTPSFDADTIYELARVSVGCDSIESQFALSDILEELAFFTDKLERNTVELVTAVKDYFPTEFAILRSIPGIADVTASHLIAEIGDISRFASVKKLIAYAGTDPGIEQSGSSINRRKHISKRGNQHLRRAIFLAACSVSHHNDIFSTYYSKKHTEDKFSYKKSIIACANKLFALIFSLLSKKEVFRLNYS